MQEFKLLKNDRLLDAPRTLDVTATMDSSFEDFILSKTLLKAVTNKGYKYPSPIQKEVIPLLLNGKSVIARAKNGTGKTGAYAIPIISMIDPLEVRVQAIILVPTRELAVQTDNFFKDLGTSLQISSSCVTGGESMTDDILCLVNSPQIVVGTPGRIIDLITKGIITLDKLRILVLDDVDKLVEKGQKEATEPLIKTVSPKVQLAALSATFPASMEDFLHKYMQHAVTINTMAELALIGISQYYEKVHPKWKIQKLYALLQVLKINQLIIFCNSNKRVVLVSRLLKKYQVPSLYIHSMLPQEERLK